MKLLVVTIVAIISFSCSPKILPVVGKYPAPPIEIKSSKSFDQVWDNLVDLFAQKGLSIRIIDRSSGIIISDRSALDVTIEDAKGNPIISDAYIVVPKYKDSYTHKMIPVTGRKMDPLTKKWTYNPAYGDWNVRVKKTGDSCLINVNITNMNYPKVVMVSGKKIEQVVALTSGKTTGVFETFIANYIK